MPRIEDHRFVQRTARKVLALLGDSLSARDSEKSIVTRAIRMLENEGITETWYYDCPALVQAGSRTCLSQSGRDYVPADDEIGETNLVTVDLSPSLSGVWGDCARSFYVENGVATHAPMNSEFKRGREVLEGLHANLRSHITLGHRFGDVCDYAVSQINSMGFIHLDFLGNVGHTIEIYSSHRAYFERGNGRMLVPSDLFTFEPHIKLVNGNWGFKHEEIYFFHDGKLQVL